MRTLLWAPLGLILWGAPWSAAQPVAAPAELKELRSLEEFQAAFDSDVGKTRVVLLLSPT